MPSNEIWKTIENYPNYMVSDYGNIMSLNYRRTSKPHILKQETNNDGYKLVCLHNENGSKMMTVHRIVAKAFIFNKFKYNEINHKNNDRSDNRVSNLEWISHKDNIKQRDLTYKPKINNQITPNEVIEIRKEKENGNKIKDIYKKYSKRITFNGFEKIWYKITWKKLKEGKENDNKI